MKRKIQNGKTVDIRLEKEPGGDVNLRIDGVMVGWLAQSGRFYLLGHDVIGINSGERSCALQFGEVE